MKNTKGSILVYAILLTNFAVVIAWILFSKSEILNQNLEYQNLSMWAMKNVREKGILAIRYDRTLNSDGSGFNNTVSCPNISYNSGAVQATTVPYFENNTLFCSGANVLLSYTSDRNAFFQARYHNIIANIVGTNPFTANFSDMDLTVLSGSFSTTPSGIDIRHDSDNYSVYSTGNIAYPDGVFDNDALARFMVHGYVKKGEGWHSIFWNNAQTNEYIKKNTNNAFSGTINISQVPEGYLHFDIDTPGELKIIEFNSGAYQATKTLQKTNEQSWHFASGGMIGWLKNDGTATWGTLQENSGSLMKFDFQNKNYAIFVNFPKNSDASGNDFLKYEITAKDASGKDIYLVPLDDSSPDFITYLGNDILITSKNEYVSKQFEVIEPKVSE